MTNSFTGGRARAVITLTVIAVAAFGLGTVSGDRHPAVTAALFAVGFVATIVLALDTLALATDDLDDDDDDDEREAARDEAALDFVSTTLDQRKRGKGGRR